MLRDKSLIPLSRQHQHALALCVRIERAAPIGEADLEAWQREIAQQFRNEVSVHFAAEERVLFPAARQFEELIPLTEELVAEHSQLRRSFAQAEGNEMSATDLVAFARGLSSHIRKEERRLFERMQELKSREELVALGGQLDDALQDAEQACAMPTEATRLRPGK
jgi:hemerythrin-like domain-containing protein